MVALGFVVGRALPTWKDPRGRRGASYLEGPLVLNWTQYDPLPLPTRVVWWGACEAVQGLPRATCCCGRRTAAGDALLRATRCCERRAAVVVPTLPGHAGEREDEREVACMSARRASVVRPPYLRRRPARAMEEDETPGKKKKN